MGVRCAPFGSTEVHWDALEALFGEVIGEQLQMMPEAQREALGGIESLIGQVMPQYRVWYRSSSSTIRLRTG